MQKKYFILAFVALVMASCSNDETSENASSKSASNAVLLRDGDATTRNSMAEDFVNTWVGGDAVGVFSTWQQTGTTGYVANGTQNAKFVFNGTENYFAETPTEDVMWKDYNSPHKFSMYYPYNESATSNTAVPFDVTNVQSQAKPDIFAAADAARFNFMWYNVSGATRPFDQIVPFRLKRMLPVAEFCIVRDDDALAGYKLQSIVLKTSSTSGGLKTGTITVDLTAASGYTDLPFTSSTAVANYTLNVTADNFAIDNLGMGRSFSAFMSINPCALQGHTVVATFTNGTNTKVITTTYDNANFTITAGKGNIVRYYLKSSQSTDNGGGSETPTGTGSFTGNTGNYTE